MDPNSGKVYKSIEDAKNAGVKEPLEVIHPTPQTFILSANQLRYDNTKKDRVRAQKAQRKAQRRKR